MVSFFRLNSSFIQNWDEAFYADGMRSLLQTHQWVIPSWNQEPFLDKPPLHIWVSSVGVQIFGPTSFGFRFTSALALFTTLVLVYWFTHKKFGQIPAIIAFSTLLTNTILIWRARGANTDSLLTLLVFLVFLTWHWQKHWKYPFLGLLLSLVYLTKSTVVLFPLFALGVLELTEIWLKRHTLQWLSKLRDWIFGLLMLTVLPAIWLYAGTRSYGLGFISFYLFHSDYGAAGVSLSAANLLYLQTLFSSFGPSMIVILMGILLALTRYQQAVIRSLLLFSLPLVIALSFSPIHYHWYLMPSLPMLAILAGFAISEIRKQTPKWLVYLLVSLILGGSLVHGLKHLPHILWDNAAYHQAKSGEWLNIHTQPGETIVRLDDKNPTVAFYANRHVMVSSPNSPTAHYFISRSDLLSALREKRLKWVNGTTSDIVSLSAQLPPELYTLHAITSDESILQIK